MKMSDFFGRDAINFFGFFCCELPDLPHEAVNEQLRAAFHAVKQHDALTQLNKELVELIAEMNEGCSADIRADELIKRAKELAE